MLVVGDIVERYQVERLIGVGGMATVYEVKHRLLGSRHALKVLRETTTFAAKQFLKEGRIQARIDPENVVPVTDVMLVNGAPALVMPLVDGCSLADVLEEYEPTEWEAAAILYAVTCGISSAHEIGVIHLDLKPSNVLLDIKHGRVRVRVSDFGLALQPEDSARWEDMFLGTPGFAAPEQYRGHQHVDRRADLWAIGAIFVHMLTGAPPYLAESLNDTYALMEESAYNFERLPSRWRELARRLLQRDAKLRMDDLNVVLELIRRETTILTIRVGSPLVDAIERAKARVQNQLAGNANIEATRYEKGSSSRHDTAKDSGLAVAIGASTDEPVLRPASPLDSDSSEPQSVLPRDRDTFIGRRAELSALDALIQRKPQVLTVLGMGGTGKTRFVRQYARDVAGAWPGGVLFCDLTEAHSATDMCSAHAQVLRVPLHSGDDVEVLGQILAVREPTLLIFDNFEQIVDSAASVVGRWAEVASRSRFLITSRIVLSLPGEQTYVLAPLSAQESVSLFIHRARKVKPNYDPTEEEKLVVHTLVTL